jgi:hypothetical protein
MKPLAENKSSYGKLLKTLSYRPILSCLRLSVKPVVTRFWVIYVMIRAETLIKSAFWSKIMKALSNTIAEKCAKYDH